MANTWPSWCDGLMSTTPGSIKRRFPTYWSDGEGGIDWGVKPGTPIIALADGVLVGAGYFCNNTPQNFFMSSPYPCNNPDYGVVTIRVKNSDGSQTDLYYQHILIDPSIKLCDKGLKSCGGQTIKKGDVIGTANPGGFIEVGVNVGNSLNNPPWTNGWGGIWGADKSPGPHIDPENYIRSLATNYNSNTAGSPLGVPGIINTPAIPTLLVYATPFITIAQKTQDVATGVPGFTGLINALDNVEKFQPWQLPSSGGSDSPVLAGISGVIASGTGITGTVGKLPADAIQATLIFVATNTMAFLIRALIVIIGFTIVTTLIRNALGITPSNALKLAETIGPLLV